MGRLNISRSTIYRRLKLPKQRYKVRGADISNSFFPETINQDFSIFEMQPSENSDTASGDFNERLKPESFKENFISLIFLYPSVPRQFINQLLHLLQKHNFIKDLGLPTDTRTLLKTPRSISKKIVPGGQYYHFGIRKSVINHLSFIKPQSHAILLNVNVDGVPLYNSNASAFWPILGNLYQNGRTSDCFLIGLYFGKKKPLSFNDYFDDFVTEFLSIEESGGIEVSDKILPLVIRCFVCDAPAKASVLYTVSHTSKHACNICTIVGKHDGISVTFGSDFEFPLYTNDDFKNKSRKDHHLGTSILETLNLNLVQQFPPDYMHTVLLGVVKKIILYWIQGKQSIYKLKQPDIAKFDRLLLECNNSLCVEFQRKHRKVTEIAFWKATELRTFLLYSGPVILKHVLSPIFYNHFMSLHLAIKILCAPHLYKKLNSFAHDLLKYFVQMGSELYDHFTVFNVHNLLHLSQNAYFFGPLDTFSAFKFESYLQILKKLPIKNNQPLEQVIKRVTERQNIYKDYDYNTHGIFFSDFNETEQTYSRAKFDNFTLHINSIANGVCILKNNKSIFLKCFKYIDNQQYLVGSFFDQRSEFLPNEFDNTCFNYATYNSLLEDEVTLPISEIMCKACCFINNNDSGYTIFPLIHTLL